MKTFTTRRSELLFRQVCRQTCLALCAAAILPLAMQAQSPSPVTTPSKASGNVSDDKASDGASSKPRKTRVTIIKDDGKSKTRVYVDSSEVALDFPEISDSIRTRIHEALKDIGEVNIDGRNGSFNFSFKRGDGSEENVFSFKMDSSMKALGRSLRGLGRLRMLKPRAWSMPPVPPAGRSFMWDWSDERPELTTEGAKRLEAEAEAMKTEAEALRKEADAMRKEAEAIRKRAEALRLEAKTKKSSEKSADKNEQPATTPSKKEQKK
jgi:hypothetical protein